MLSSQCPMILSFSDTVNSLIGNSWKWQTQGPKEFDCIGICIYLTDVIFDIDIYHPFIFGDKLKTFYQSFEIVQEMKMGDWIQENPGDNFGKQHLLMVENKKYAVECKEGFGVQRRKLKDIEPNKIIHRLKELC